jgi:NADH-quinone oxidoreductase subunit N
MPGNEALRAMLPEHLLLGGLIVLIIVSMVRGARSLALPIALGTVAASAGAAFWLAASGLSSEPFVGHFVVTPTLLLVKGALLALALPVLLMSRSDFSREGLGDTEFPTLVVASLYGLSLLPSAASALVLFLGLEMMSIPVYALIVLAFKRPQSAESALKYLVLSGAASATLLMGISLVYGATGSMALTAYADAFAQSDLLARTGVVLVLLALFLKAAVVPFHAWAPDTYEGASVPVTAYMATLSKAAVLVMAVRLFDGITVTGPMVQLVAVLPLVSIVWGNIAAIRQTNLRRMIAYSSIAHAGYLFYAFLGGSEGRLEAVTFYIVVYSAANLLAFALLPEHADDVARDRMETLDGLFHRDPMAASLIAVAMLSLAGLPPFPGFTAKFLIFKSVIAAGYSTYAVLGLVGSFLGLFFYLRVIQRMFMQPSSATNTSTASPFAARAAGILCLAATAVLMIVPGWLLDRL